MTSDAILEAPVTNNEDHQQSPFSEASDGYLPSADRRINDLFQLAETGNYDCLSLSLFDSTFWRKVPGPEDLFYLIGNELIEEEHLDPGATPSSFVIERINAESRARYLKQDSNEVTLEEIYAEFPSGFLKNITPDEVCELEFEFEMDAVRIYPEMLALIEFAKNRALKVALVSDTCFSRVRIDKLLGGLKVDHIILSCEHGISKSLGLHEVLVNVTSLPVNKILHAGGNFDADVRVPGELGIDCYWFRKFEDDYAEAIEAELPAFFPKRETIMQGDDCGLTALRSQAMSTAQDRYERWGSGILGPVVAGYCDWVIQRTREEKIDTVLCLLPEGEIIRQALEVSGSDLKAELFYSSRFSVAKAAIIDGTQDEISDYIVSTFGQDTRMLLEQLGLGREDLQQDIEKALSSNNIPLIAKRISETPVLKEKVLRASSKARQNLLKHLSLKLDLKSLKKLAVLSLDYSATVQRSLQKVIGHENSHIRTYGFYWLTGSNVYRTQSTGARSEGWLAHNNQPMDFADAFIRSSEVIEQSLMPQIATTPGQDDEGEDTVSEKLIDQGQREAINRIQQGMLKFCQQWAEHKQKYGIKSTEHLKTLYRNICFRFITQPVSEELKLFTPWRHDDNSGGTIKGLTEFASGEWELDFMSVRDWISLRSTDLYWPFGLARQRSKNLGKILRKIYSREVEPQLFDQEPIDRQITFLMDDGAGFSNEKCETKSFTANHKNKVRERFTITLNNSACTVVGFSLGRNGDLIGVKGMVIHYHESNGDYRKKVIEHDTLEKAGCQLLHKNIYLVNSDSPVFLTRQLAVKNYSGRIDVDIFFSLIEEGEL